MKVVLVGLPYFARKIAKDLARRNSNDAYLALDPSAGVWQKARYVWHMLSSDVLYQIGGSHYCGGTLRLAMRLNKKIVMHWVGTDVLNAKRAQSVGKVDVDLIRKSKHLCEVDWIQNELLEIGIRAEIAMIASFPDDIPAPPPLPDKFSILSYVGKGRERLFDFDKLIQLGEIFPSVPIRITGISDFSKPLPPNIELLGWVNDMPKEYRDCVLFLRLPAHDGLAFSVLEALSHGRYVGYTYPLRGTTRIPNMSELRELVETLSRLHANGTLGVNSEGYEYITGNFRETAVMSSLRETIAKHASSVFDLDLDPYTMKSYSPEPDERKE